MSRESSRRAALRVRRQGQGVAVASQEGHPEAVGLRVKEGGLRRGGQQVLQPGQGEDPGVGWRASGGLARLQTQLRRQDHGPHVFFPDLLGGLEPHPEIPGAALHLHQVGLGQELDAGMGLGPADQVLQFRAGGLGRRRRRGARAKAWRRDTPE